MQRKSKSVILLKSVVLVPAFLVFRIKTDYGWEYKTWEKYTDLLEPRVRLVAGEGPAKPYLDEYAFTKDWFTDRIPSWEKALDSFKGKPNIHYLEVGLFEGRSAIWMLENVLTHPSARLTGIDVFSGDVKRRYLANIKRSGAEDKVTTIVGSSQVRLREFPPDHFDIIYIDGSHLAADVLEDAILSARLLKAGGVLFFDDYRWRLDFPPERRPKKAINTFLEYYGDQYEVIDNDYQLILMKKEIFQDAADEQK